MDSEANAKQIERLGKRQLGYRATFTDLKTGKPLDTYKMGGVVYHPNDKGEYTILDKSAIELEAKVAREMDELINDYVKLCITSDETAATILGWDYAYYMNVMGTNPPDIPLFYIYDETGRNLGPIPTEIAKADARASILRLYSASSDSKVAVMGFSKLRYVLGLRMPMVESSGLNEEKAEEFAKETED
jgi:hypothetical protein